MRLGHIAFFHSTAGSDLIDGCIRLALVFKTSPTAFVDLPGHALAMLMERTNEILKTMREDDG